MKARMLKKNKLLLYVWNHNSVKKIQRDLTSKSIKVKHFSTLFEIFPNLSFRAKTVLHDFFFNKSSSYNDFCYKYFSVNSKLTPYRHNTSISRRRHFNMECT